MDIGNGYFMVLFDEVEDRNKVINGEPWMIFDHILLVRLWTPEFIADRATIDKTLVWVCIPSLNILYYDESFLTILASATSKPVKVDMHALQVARGRFARVYVEIDLNQPVVGKVGLCGQWYNVQYECLHLICAQCGCYGHVMKDCKAVKPAPVQEAAKAVEGSNQTPASGNLVENPLINEQNI